MRENITCKCVKGEVNEEKNIENIYIILYTWSDH